MAIATTTTWANAIRAVYNPQVLTDLVFANRSLFDMASFASLDSAEAGYAQTKGLFPVIPSRGDTHYRWPVIQATGAADMYAEGEAAPAPGNTTTLMAALAYSDWYAQRTIEITGHARDAARDEAEIINMFDVEVQSAVKSIVDIINTTAMGSVGLQLAVDSAGTYAGINRSTYSNWGSYESAVSGAQSRSALDDMIEALMDNDRGAAMQDLIILCPQNQLTNHGALAGLATTSTNIPIQAASGGTLDLGFTAHSHMGIPMIGVPDMTDTEIYCLHRPSVKWVMHRPLQIEEKEQQGDTMRWLLTMAVALVVERPNLCGKLTGVTA